MYIKITNLLLIAFFAIYLPLYAQSNQLPKNQTSPNESYVGVHGMFMFGGSDGLFASHLPMYHQPHNVQLVFGFHLIDSEIDRKVRRVLENTSKDADQIWTIVPEKFDITRLSEFHPYRLKTLTVDLVDGHFERGGKVVFSQLEIAIGDVKMFQVLDTKTVSDDLRSAIDPRYCVVSVDPQSTNQFLVKELGTRPEADHILRIEHAVGLLPSCITVNFSSAVPAAEPRLFVEEARLKDALINGRLKGSALDESERITMGPEADKPLNLRTLYLEINELR